MKNENAIIGLFQGMFDKHADLQSGWDQNANKLDSFTDIRDLQRLKDKGSNRDQETGKIRPYGKFHCYRSDPILMDPCLIPPNRI